MDDWGWWLIGFIAFWWAMDIHRRVSVTMDAVQRIEERLRQSDPNHHYRD